MKNILVNGTSDSSVSTKQVLNSFSKQAFFYDQAAHTQKIVSKELFRTINAQRYFPSSGNILDIGCGTGLLSEDLIKQFPTYQTYLLDPAPGMLQSCKKKLSKELNKTSTRLNVPIFIESTIENYLNNQTYKEIKYSLIVSSFAFHWLADLHSVINELTSRLEISGKLFFACPIKGSFPEWQGLCETLGLPFTANQLPAIDELKASINAKHITFYFREYSIERYFSDALLFFQEMKMLGAQKRCPQSAENHISVAQFRHLLRYWNEQKSNKNCTDKKKEKNTDKDKYNQTISCTYRIIEGIITRHK